MRGLLLTDDLLQVAYDFGQGSKPIYALEGSIAVAGSGVKFLMNNMGFAAESHKISELAATVPDNGDCYFVTAFSGLFAPYWIDDAKGTIFGITAHTQKGHIARATLEATCFQTKAILDAMEKDSGKKLAELAVDGGMSNSDLCMQVCQSFVDHESLIISRRPLYPWMSIWNASDLVLCAIPDGRHASGLPHPDTHLRDVGPEDHCNQFTGALAITVAAWQFATSCRKKFALTPPCFADSSRHHRHTGRSTENEGDDCPRCGNRCRICYGHLEEI